MGYTLYFLYVQTNISLKKTLLGDSFLGYVQSCSIASSFLQLYVDQKIF